MSFDIRLWWAALSAVSLINIAVWCIAARSLQRMRPSLQNEPAIYAARRTQLLLALVYVLVCAFRSFLPRADVQRICLFDTPLSSVFVGRTVATIAELCFAMQWSLFIQMSGEAVGDRVVRGVGRALFPMIVWAEIASWYAVVSTNFLGNVIEQSTWTLGGALIGLCYIKLYPQADEQLRLFFRRSSPIVLAFIYFMCTVDIPHYYARWSADQQAGKQYLALADGLRDAATRWIVTYEWAEWTDEVAWMTLYFSVGVWLSIAFSHAPLRAARAASRSAPTVGELSVD
jgi:hypothetical protein